MSVQPHVAAGFTPALRKKQRAEKLRARRARPGDAQAIHRLIAHYAEQGLLLPRSEEEVREHLPRFLVIEEKETLLGCVALERYGTDLAEVRSLAVNPEIHGRGVGARLLRFALVEAKRRKIARVFAVTHAPEFFARQGFVLSTRTALPEKVERDCRVCPKQRTCQLAAVVFTVLPERAALSVIPDVSTSTP